MNEEYKRTASIEKEEPREAKVWRATTDGSYAAFFVLEPVYNQQETEIVDFTIQYANDTGAWQFGTSVDELESSPASNHFADEQISYFREVFLSQLAGEQIYVVPDDKPNAGRWAMQAVPVSGKVVVRRRSVKSDKAILEELEREMLKDRTEHLEKAIREAGHDLRTPMSIIKTSLHLAERLSEIDPARARAHQQQARQQVDRLNEMVGELVDIAKMKEDGIDFQLIFAGDFVRHVYRDFFLLAQEQSKKVILGSVTEGCVLGHRDKLYRAYTNLVQNALTYSDPGDTVTLSAERFGDKVHLRVADTGIGISKDNLKKIFGKFYRVDFSRGQGEGNQGMGLSIAQEIVALHNGHIEVQSKEGEGTAFSIILPYVDPNKSKLS